LSAAAVRAVQSNSELVSGAAGVAGDAIDALENSAAEALRQHEDSVGRLAQVPGLGADSAQQMIAEVGAGGNVSFRDQMSSWVDVCPGREESAEVSASDRSPKGNRICGAF